MPLKSFDQVAVGVEPPETIGQGIRAARRVSAAVTIAVRSCSATAAILSGVLS
jgi:triosephosphate isomerase